MSACFFSTELVQQCLRILRYFFLRATKEKLKHVSALGFNKDYNYFKCNVIPILAVVKRVFK